MSAKHKFTKAPPQSESAGPVPLGAIMVLHIKHAAIDFSSAIESAAKTAALAASKHGVRLDYQRAYSIGKRMAKHSVQLFGESQQDPIGELSRGWLECFMGKWAKNQERSLNTRAPNFHSSRDSS